MNNFYWSITVEVGVILDCSIHGILQSYWDLSTNHNWSKTIERVATGNFDARLLIDDDTKSNVSSMQPYRSFNVVYWLQ